MRQVQASASNYKCDRPDKEEKGGIMNISMIGKIRPE